MNHYFIIVTTIRPPEESSTDLYVAGCDLLTDQVLVLVAQMYGFTEPDNVDTGVWSSPDADLRVQVDPIPEEHFQVLKQYHNEVEFLTSL